MPPAEHALASDSHPVAVRRLQPALCSGLGSNAKADGQVKIADPKFAQGDSNDVFVKRSGGVVDFNGIIRGDGTLTTAMPALVIAQCAVSCAGGALCASGDEDAHGTTSASFIKSQGHIDCQTFKALSFGASH